MYLMYLIQGYFEPKNRTNYEIKNKVLGVLIKSMEQENNLFGVINIIDIFLTVDNIISN